MTLFAKKSMNTFLRLTATVLVLFTALSSFAQSISFDRSYSLPNNPAVKKFVLDSNGGSIAVYTSSATITSAFSVIRFDTIGNILWQHNYDNTQLFSAVGMDAIAMPNGDFMIAFSGVLSDFTTKAVGLFRIGSNGNVIWEKAFTSGSTIGNQFAPEVKIVKATDGSIYMTAIDYDPTASPSNDELILFRFSGNGNLISTKVFSMIPLRANVLSAGAAGGINIAATNINTFASMLISVDSTGNVISSMRYNALGFCTDLHTDNAGVVRAMLHTDFFSTTQLIELDAAGNVTNARNATGGTNASGGDLMYRAGVYISGNQGGLGGTSLCNWSASPSMQNGLSFSGTELFTAFDFIQIADGSIYMYGYTQNDPLTVLSGMIKTTIPYGGNLPLGNCTESADNFTITQATPFSWAPVSTTLSNYTPATQASVFQLLPLQVIATTNCSQVSVNEIEHTRIQSFPNPVSGIFQIEGDFTADAVIRFFNSAGQESALSVIERSSNVLRADLSSLPDGIYFLQTTTTSGKIATAKLVVAH
jgi:hypothetical protein